MTAPPPSLQDLLAWPSGQAPWAKQEEAHQRSSGERLFALFMEQRTGKTIVSLGTIAYQFRRFLDAGGFGPPSPTAVTPFALLPPRFATGTPGKRLGSINEGRISDLPKKPSNPGMVYRPAHWNSNKGLDALVVIAMPGGVPGNWAEEAALRLPAWANQKTLLFSADAADKVETAKAFKALLCHRGLALFLINGEAITTPLAKKALGTFLRCRRALVIGDETSLICSQPGNKRSHVMEAIRKLPGAIARRILDGTPGDESPLDMFSQMRFLDEKYLGFDSWVAFKRFYASWEPQEIWKKNPATGKPEPLSVLKQAVDENTGKKIFANLDIMAERLAPVSFRVKRTDCFDIPAKVFAPYRFDLSAAQRNVYDPLREEFEAWLADGSRVTATNVLARMTRLDQVSANYWPPTAIPLICPDCQGEGCVACADVGAIMSKTAKKIIDKDRNPRLEALGDVLSLNHEPGIVWAVFDETIDAAITVGEKLGRKVVRYDGKVDDVDKATNLLAFKTGKADLMVSKESSGGRGLNLSAGKWMAYLENGYSKRKRSQSEDRAEVSGRTFGTGIIDIIANDTYDDRKLLAHQNKGDTSNFLWRCITSIGRAA